MPPFLVGVPFSRGERRSLSPTLFAVTHTPDAHKCMVYPHRGSSKLLMMQGRVELIANPEYRLAQVRAKLQCETTRAQARHALEMGAYSPAMNTKPGTNLR